MAVGIESLTPEQQLQFRKAEGVFQGFRPTVRIEIVDAMEALENLILIETADNVSVDAKDRIKKLRGAIKEAVIKRH